MGRPSNAEIAARNAQKEPSVMPRLIYVPGPEDASETVWNRHKFLANVPTEIKDIRNGYTAKEMLALARNNRFFQIEGEEKVPTVAQEPVTSEQYRAYAAMWIRSAKSVTALESRWESEKELREDCDVGVDDIEYISTLFNPRKAELHKAEKLSAALVDG